MGEGRKNVPELVHCEESSNTQVRPCQSIGSANKHGNGRIFSSPSEGVFDIYYTGSHKTLGTILRDPIVPNSVGQVGFSGYSAILSSQSAR